MFRLPVADLLRQPGAVRRVHVSGHLPNLGGSAASAEGDVEAELTLESVPGHTIVAHGTVRAAWTGECRRCLGAAAGDVTSEVREIFEPGSDGEETYPVKGDEIDVEPLVRDAVLLELPLAPLCREACQGLCPACGANRNDVACGHEPDTRDPRWAALDQFVVPEARKKAE